jgi:hypothetical protein
VSVAPTALFLAQWRLIDTLTGTRFTHVDWSLNGTRLACNSAGKQCRALRTRVLHDSPTDDASRPGLISEHTHLPSLFHQLTFAWCSLVCFHSHSRPRSKYKSEFSGSSNIHCKRLNSAHDTNLQYYIDPQLQVAANSIFMRRATSETGERRRLQHVCAVSLCGAAAQGFAHAGIWDAALQVSHGCGR